VALLAAAAAAATVDDDGGGGGGCGGVNVVINSATVAESQPRCDGPPDHGKTDKTGGYISFI